MRESGYYPPGAEFDPNAPYNQVDIPERSFDVFVTQTLSKSTSVETDDYVPELDEDEDGKYTYYDTSDTDWVEAYKNDNHLTPLELISEFKDFLETYMPDPVVNKGLYIKFKHLVTECEGWTEDECEIMKD